MPSYIEPEPDLDNPPPRLVLETAFPHNMNPEFYFYLGWTDLRSTQEKFINERKGFMGKWEMLKMNLQQLFTCRLENTGRYNQINHGNGCPNGFYECGVECALHIANREPLRLIERYHVHHNAVPFRPAYPDTCDFCKREATPLLYVSEGPCMNAAFCSEECLNKEMALYLERPDCQYVKLMANDQIERPIVTLDKTVQQLSEMLSSLPIRSNAQIVEPKPYSFD